VSAWMILTLLTLDIYFSFHSWDDFAKSDIPATLNYILNFTKSSSLSYVGHSQGTTIAFAEFSRNQTWASKVDLFIALAPVAYVGNMVSPLKYLSYFTGEIEVVCRLFDFQDN
jgi:lysosomal acid lipase/cholesteryl ester hydrolase